MITLELGVNQHPEASIQRKWPFANVIDLVMNMNYDTLSIMMTTQSQAK